MNGLVLEKLPFLRSLCWQGRKASIAHWSDLEVLGLYEQNWRFRGVMVEVSEGEAKGRRRGGEGDSRVGAEASLLVNQ